MGNGCSSAGAASASEGHRTVYVQFGPEKQAKVEAIRIDINTSTQDVCRLLAQMVGGQPENVCVRNYDGQIMLLTSDLASNTQDKPYRVDTILVESSKLGESMKDTVSIKETTQAPTQSKPKDKSKKRKQQIPLYEFSNETLKYLKTPSFDVWKWNSAEMLNLIRCMINEFNICEELNINHESLDQFLLEVRETYRDNPFHNFRHAFCVIQMMYGLLHITKMHEHFSTEEIFCLLISTLCHDMDHPGYSNSYLINARTKLALRYNDKSPLENHHASMCFQTMAKPECNILANVNNEAYRGLRGMIIKLILATDMVDHAVYVNDWKKINRAFDPENVEHRTVLMKLLIKCCDISNEIRPMQVSDQWLDRLLDEYFTQGDHEKAQGLPTLPFMDRTKTTRASAQVGFIKFVLIPLFESLVPAFGEPVEEMMVDPLRNALTRYEKIKNEEDATKAKAEAEKKAAEAEA